LTLTESVLINFRVTKDGRSLNGGEEQVHRFKGCGDVLDIVVGNVASDGGRGARQLIHQSDSSIGRVLAHKNWEEKGISVVGQGSSRLRNIEVIDALSEEDDDTRAVGGQSNST